MKAAFTPGTTFASYRVESLLGRGGMGVVYLARDLSLERPVALKLIAPELAQDEEFRARFLREPKLAASLDHPNVIPIYEAGEHDGQLYLAMRYVEGSDLRTLLKRESKLSPERMLAILAQVAGALDAAHRRALVHRDMKPANVLLDEDGHAYLTDFGITKQIGGASTDTGRLVGTLDYLAPEQIRGESVDARTDSYALGCVLYECLAGKPPFRRDSEAATMWAHMQDEPPPLRGHARLDAVLRKALAKNREDRYAICGELIERAAAALGLQVAGAPPRPIVPTAVRRRAPGILAVGGLLLAVVVGLAILATTDAGDAQEDVTPAVAAVRPLTAPSCSPMDYRPGTRPRHLIVSDQQSDLGEIGTQVAAAVEFVIRERGFEAGGTPVAFQVCDSDPSKCDEAAKDYADNPSVIGVIGPLMSTCAEAEIPVANRARPGPLALVSATTTRVGLTRPSPVTPDEPDSLYPTGIRNFVRVQAADDFQLAALAMYAKRSGVRSLFLIADGEECDTDGGPFGAAAQRLGLQVAGCAFYNDTSGNPAHLARRVARSGADAVYLPITAAVDGGRLIRALRARQGRDLLLLGGDGFSDPRFRDEVGRAANGIRATVAGVDPKALTGRGRELIDRLRETVGEPHPYTVSAVQATELLLDAIARSDGTRRSVVRELFDSEVRGGVLGDFSVTPTGDTTANRVTIYEIEDGELVLDRLLTPPLGLVVSPRAETAPEPTSAAPEGEEMLVVPVGSEAEAVRLCDVSRKRWPRAFAGHDRVFLDKVRGTDFTCFEPTDPPEPSRAPDGPRGEVRYVAPVSGPEHAERVCDAARERWPRAYARYDEVLLDQFDGRDLTCVRP